MLISGVIASTLLIGAFTILLAVGAALTLVDHRREPSRFVP